MGSNNIFNLGKGYNMRLLNNYGLELIISMAQIREDKWHNESILYWIFKRNDSSLVQIDSWSGGNGMEGEFAINLLKLMTN